MNEGAVAQPQKIAGSTNASARSHLLQRKCACGGTPGLDGKCAECRKKRLSRQRHSTNQAEPTMAPSIVNEVLRSSGQPLDPAARAFMEPRFGHDFGRVRMHADSQAAESARAVNALAYTVGQDVVFGAGQYAPGTTEGRRLLAHELAHTMQQRQSPAAANIAITVSAPGDSSEREAESAADLASRELPVAHPRVVVPTSGLALLQRACLLAAACAAPIPGSAAEFGVSEEAAETTARGRRSGMAPARARASGHGGRARQLELFLNAQSPGLLANIHGIFVDQDLSPGTGALTMNCASFTPPITGATKPCVFVHGDLNQQALAFNKTAAATIGGMSREDWRVQTLQALTHEVQHVMFDTAARPAPAGTTCARADVDFELSELNAIMSEFLVVFRAIPLAAGPVHPARARLNTWFSHVITNPGESIRGILHTLRCKCSCADVDAYVRDTFDFVSASWTAAEKTAFNTELREPRWGLSWPL